MCKYTLRKLFINLLAWVLCCTFIFIPAKTHAEVLFSDVPTTHSNYHDIYYLFDHGVVEKSHTYGVSDIVTREEVAIMVAKAVGLDGTPRQTIFKDVPAYSKNSGYIQSAVERGIINGYPDGTSIFSKSH